MAAGGAGLPTSCNQTENMSHIESVSHIKGRKQFNVSMEKYLKAVCCFIRMCLKIHTCGYSLK